MVAGIVSDIYWAFGEEAAADTTPVKSIVKRVNPRISLIVLDLAKYFDNSIVYLLFYTCYKFTIPCRFDDITCWLYDRIRTIPGNEKC
jgi:hypothetical protein